MKNSYAQSDRSNAEAPKDKYGSEEKKIKRGALRQIIRIALPLFFLVLFYALKSDAELMHKILTNFSFPLRNFLARLTSFIPLSVGELLCVFLIAFSLFYVVKGFVAAYRSSSRFSAAAPRFFNILTLALWIWVGFSWLWNIGYYAPGFAENNRIARDDILLEDLEVTTRYFAELTNRYADQIQRDENGLFAEEADEYFKESLVVYDNIEEIFPSLNYDSYIPKRLIFSRLQSNMGFTGFFFPFTGEANINIDAPACLQPVTIAHEIAHQRLVTSEDEANFVAIAACLSSDYPTYMYSGALMGLMKLGSALSARDPESWIAITQTLEEDVVADWNSNAEYWTQIKTPLEEVSKDVYDSFLKSNDQVLGIQSYGACIDLLISHYSAVAGANP